MEEVAVRAAGAEVAHFTAMSTDLEQIKEVLAENLGAGGMSEFDLQRIKVPSGGGIAFEVTNMDGEVAVPKIKAVVLFHRDVRAYWAQSIEESGGNSRPDCHSSDGKVGIGTPGGDCKVCPLAQFGSSKKGNGQACKQVKQLFILREDSDSILPEVFQAPPTSINAFKKYLLSVIGRQIPISSIVTEIGLVKDKSADGITYAKATFKTARQLSPVEAAKIQGLKELFKPMVATTIGIAAPADIGGDVADAEPAFT